MNITQLKERIKSRLNSLSDSDTVIFECYEFEITKREIITSIAIVAIMLMLGTIISGAIADYSEEKKKEYNQAMQIDSKELFEYGMNTSVGNAFIYGQLKAVDTVTFDEIGGQWLRISKEREDYTRHEKKVKHTDSEGNTYYETEVYYSWDHVSTESKHSEKITFMDIEFDYDLIDVNDSEYIDTIYKGFDTRYIYRGSSLEHTGTIYTNLQDGTIGKCNLYEYRTIQEVLESKNEDFGQITFWIIWILLIGFVTYGFCYFDNNWLR